MAGKRNRMTNAQIEMILRRGLEYANSTGYTVSLRWVFYKLLQEGFYSEKGDYNKWCSLCAKARKEYRLGWEPDTLADDTRETIYRAGGKPDVESCAEGLLEDICQQVWNTFNIDHFYQQDRYVEIWFEAKGMAGQFRHYTDGINLIPFGGDPSIPLKWSIAKNLETAQTRYGKLIVILYFGDYDTHGLEILDFACNDIYSWCGANFTIERCGLTPEQAAQYNVPENPDRPGQYQWAALSDEGAKEIIHTSIAEYLDTDLIDNCNSEADELADIWEKKIRNALIDL
jgi:hypothetical protein